MSTSTWWHLSHASFVYKRNDRAATDGTPVDTRAGSVRMPPGRARHSSLCVQWNCWLRHSTVQYGPKIPIDWIR